MWARSPTVIVSADATSPVTLSVFGAAGGGTVGVDGGATVGVDGGADWENEAGGEDGAAD